jgi:Tfp pilus assembly protein FimT
VFHRKAPGVHAYLRRNLVLTTACDSRATGPKIAGPSQLTVTVCHSVHFSAASSYYFDMHSRVSPITSNSRVADWLGAPLARAITVLRIMNHHERPDSLCATSAGYTLFDVLASILLMAIVSAMAVPQLSALRAEFDLFGSARRVAVELHRARMKAVAENAFCRIAFSTDGTYIRQCSADGATYLNDSPVSALPTGTTFVGTLAGIPQPTFNRLGTVAGDAAITLVNRLGQRKVVRINVLGRVTIS